MSSSPAVRSSLAGDVPEHVESGLGTPAAGGGSDAAHLGREASLAARPAGGGPGAARLGPEARLQRALDAAYRYLGKRDRTEAEVRRHLAAQDIDDASIDGAVEALIRQRYVDDARYAQTFAEDRRELDDWGPERIQRRLVALGIDPDLVAGALDRDGAAELEAAVALLRRRFREIPATDRERERALGLLARKGYDVELAYDAVRAFCGEPA